MSRLKGYLSSLRKYYLLFCLALYAAFVYRGTFLHHRRFRRVYHQLAY
jgi:hypothetical protein